MDQTPSQWVKAGAEVVRTSSPNDSLPLMPELQILILSNVQWSARATCKYFLRYVEAGRESLHVD